MRRQPTKDAWDLLAEKTQRASQLLGNATWNDIRIVSGRNRVTLKPRLSQLIGFLFFVPLGTVIIYLSITQSRNPFVGILFGLLFIAVAFLLSNYIKHISWETGGNDILISYDLGPFYKKLKLSRGQLIARLDYCKQDMGRTNVRKGAVKLCLERTDCSKPQVIIAISGKGTNLNKAFEELNDFLSGQSTDSTLAEVTLAQGQQTLIPAYADVEGGFSGQKSREIVMSSDDMIILKRCWPDTIILSLGVGFAIFLLVGPYFLYKQEKVKDWSFWIIEIIVPLIGLCLFVWYSHDLIQFYRGWYLTADKKTDALMLSGVMPAISKPSILCNLSAIGAFQLCSFISHGKKYDTTFYKLHAVLNNPLGTRLTMYCSTDREQITEQAKLLAKFLNVPFYDHVLASD
jgi:hypothetical protein